MAGSKVLREAVRRRIRDEQHDVDLVADVNLVVAHGGGAASSQQHVAIRQGRGRTSRTAETAMSTPPSPEEDAT